MIINGENGVVYNYYRGPVFKLDKNTGTLSCDYDAFIFVDTRNRKAFIMRKEYIAIDENGKELKCICKSTHQDSKKSCFGGFGFEVV